MRIGTVRCFSSIPKYMDGHGFKPSYKAEEEFHDPEHGSGVVREFHDCALVKRSEQRYSFYVSYDPRTEFLCLYVIGDHSHDPSGSWVSPAAKPGPGYQLRPAICRMFMFFFRHDGYAKWTKW